MVRLIKFFDLMILTMRRWLRQRVTPGSKLDSALKKPSYVLSRIVPTYRRMSGNGVFFRPSELHACSSFPKGILDATIHIFQPKSILDVGCGTGVSLDYFLERGIDAAGVEGSHLAISQARNPTRIIEHNLNEVLKLERQFDLIWTYEVAEHIHPRYVQNLLTTLTTHADIVVMSAARPGQGGEGHFNEQEPEYWEAKFQQFRFVLDREVTAKLRSTGEMWSGNMLAFRRVGL